MTTHRLSEHPIHLGLGARAEVEPEFTGDLDWYGAYMDRHDEVDGQEARLVSEHIFTEDWTVWECHPEGSEVVYCLAGEMTLIQETGDGDLAKIVLKTGDYAINAPGVWHTADIGLEARALFITAGRGTQHKPR
jgi:uncharacterized cupin superfamily protein